ncbi:MAG: MFS transporter [Promethearchaeota archaeon]
MEHQKEIAPEELVKTSIKFSFGLTSLGAQVVHGVFQAALIIYFREKMLLPEVYIFWAFMFFAIWNAINDPLFGWISDKTKTKWGRRIPYLAVFTPIMTISFIFIWLSPTKGDIGELGVFFYMLIIICIYDTAYTAALLVWTALGQELSMDHRERASIQVYSLILGVIGTLIALIVPSLFLDQPGREGFIYLSITLAFVQFITMMITAFTIKERLEFSHVDEPMGFFDAFKNTLKRKSFLTTVSMNFFLIFIQSVLFGNLFFYTYYAVPEVNSDLLLLLVVGFTLAGVGFGTYYTVKVNEEKGVKTAMLRAIILHGLGFLLVGILPGIIAVIGFFLVGIGIYAAMTLFNVAFAEVIDEDEVDTGRRREAAIMGINALITKPAESLAGGFIAIMLLFFKYTEPIEDVQQPQSDLTILGIKLAMGVIPAIVAFLAAFIYNMNPLYGEHLNQIKTKMYKIHEEKKEKLQEILPKRVKE